MLSRHLISFYLYSLAFEVDDLRVCVPYVITFDISSVMFYDAK